MFLTIQSNQNSQQRRFIIISLVKEALYLLVKIALHSNKHGLDNRDISIDAKLIITDVINKFVMLVLSINKVNGYIFYKL